MTNQIVTLLVYAYSSFTSSWGAGPEVIELFQKQCQCQVLLVDAGDAGSMLSRLKIEGKKNKADVVVGIDGAYLWRVKKDLNWDPAKAIAFDKAPLAFVYNQTQLGRPPKSLDDLLLPEYSKQIIIQDPRISTTGLGFLLWVIKDRGEEKAWKYFQSLKNQVKVTTPGWDLAYGLFKKNQSKLVLSYWSSPAYHIAEEHNENFKAAEFKGAHYEQVEYAIVNPQSQQKELAEKFVGFLKTEAVQKLLMEKNYMYPVDSKVKLSFAFEKLGRVKTLPALSQNQLEKNLESWLKKWREVFSP